MSPPRLKPTPDDLARWPVLLARDPASPSGLCWRDRPLSLFKREADWASWTVQWAWKPAGTCADGRWRLVVNGRKFLAEDIVTALERSGPDTLRPDGDALDEVGGGSGNGALADILDDARRDMGLTLSDLTVLSGAHDPYRVATPSRMRDAQWFAEQWAASGAPHLRGFHYKLIGRATKPDGEPYTGSFDDWRWLKSASAAARWLGLVPFDELEDRRSGDPIIHRAERRETTLVARASAGFRVATPPSVTVTTDAQFRTGWLDFYPALSGLAAEQPYVLAIFGEKSSLDEELRPIAVEKGADLYLETGEQSITHAHHIAARAVADGRPLIVLTVTDCDPSGYQMAVSIARKLQALRDLKFPTLDVDVIHVGLTPDQVREFGLPSSPLSDKDKRKARWIERMGVEQTEVDSLLALHPGALAQMVRDALAPYYDSTLVRRVAEAERRWRIEAHRAIQDEIANNPRLSARREGIEARASDASARIEALTAEAETLNAEAERINAAAELINVEIEDINLALWGFTNEIDLDPPDLPEPDLPDRPTDGPGMVLSSSWDWIEATRRLKARKAYEGDDAEPAP